MKGILWKWTNYWMGWQPRWFILSDGILSYYKSEEEVKQGCKGSVSLTACDISAHATDSLRVDIVIPGEQHIYVKAASTLERQQWLVALGTSKAKGTDCRNRKNLDSTTNPDVIKSKKSELRLYCDLLMQQVHSIKEAATAESGPDISKLDEATSLLSATCDTFIKTLDDCIRISNAVSPYAQASSPHMATVIPNLNTTKGHSNGGSSNGMREKPRSLSHASSSSQDLH